MSAAAVFYFVWLLDVFFFSVFLQDSIGVNAKWFLFLNQNIIWDVIPNLQVIKRLFWWSLNLILYIFCSVSRLDFLVLTECWISWLLIEHFERFATHGIFNIFAVCTWNTYKIAQLYSFFLYYIIVILTYQYTYF